MKKISLSLVVVLLFMFALASTAQAFQNEPEGFRGLKWGDPPGEDMALHFVNFWGDPLDPAGEAMLPYIRENDKLQIGRVEVRDVRYFFYENKFMEVQIKTGTICQTNYYDLKDILNLKFGEGKEIITKGLPGGRLAFSLECRWIGDTATIILSSDEWSGVVLEIYSTKIYIQYQEYKRRKKEEERRKEEEEKRKAAEEGLTDF